MTLRAALAAAFAGVWLATAPAAAQTATDGDAVLERIRQEATQRSALRPLARALLDSIGHRLTGSPGQQAAHEWAVERYRDWGIEARNDRYGTWRGWRRGATHVDLVAPRAQTLDGAMLAWSPSSNGPLTAGAVVPPALANAAEWEAWLPTVAGRFVMLSFAQPSCRPDESIERWAAPGTLDRIRAERSAGVAEWSRRLETSGVPAFDLPARLEAAGAAGIVVSQWAGGWGVERFHTPARTARIPSILLGCEDYALVFRLAESGGGAVLRLNAEAETLGEVPVFNTIAEIRGRERPDEYVVLSAHFDSWDGHSGATDNGTGTVTMMEVMRILRQVYPAPKRTILVGHWSGEEQGLNGSRAFAADYPEVVRNLHVLFNQDTGTGRIQSVGMQGLTRAAERWARWLDRMPAELVRELHIESPGLPSPGSSDHSSFICAGAPAFFLLTLDWDYSRYTWHTNRDSYDKIVWEDLERNVQLIAMLAYLAAEDADPFPRDRLAPERMPFDERTGARMPWPRCQPPARSWDEAMR